MINLITQIKDKSLTLINDISIYDIALMCNFASKIYSKMGLNIKKAIADKQLTSKEVAERMGISAVGLSQHINGNPSVEVLTRIAAAIGCDVSELFDKVDNTTICPHCGKPIELKKAD